jgi:membrane fusion protein (multidrug efflux system)
MLVAAACRGPAATPAGPAGAAEPRAIEVATVVRQPLDVPLSLAGELTAFQAVALHPRVTGFVASVAVDRGSRVRRGAALMTLDAPDLVAQRAEAQARVLAADAQLGAARARAAADAGTYAKLKAAAATPGVVAGNDVVVAEQTATASASQVTAAEQSVEAARQALGAVRELEGYLTISAPFDGVITERAVHPGALVGPSGAAVLQLVDDRRLRLVVPIPEAYAGAVSAGAAIPFTVAGYPGQAFTGTVARIAGAVEVATRTMAVELDVANGDGRLAPGTFCQVRWPVHRTEPSLFVPSGSVATTTDRTFVIRIRDGKAEWVDVRTGLTSGPLIEVFGALEPGDVVAARATDEIKAGDAIRVRQATPAA